MLNLCIGRRELGKTTLAVHLARFYQKRVLWDPRHMISTSDVILDDTNIEGLYDAISRYDEVIVRAHFNVEETFEIMCEQIQSWITENQGTTFCLLLDEIRFTPKPDDEQNFNWIVRCTPRETVSVIVTAHGVPDINTNMRRIADYWILFQLTLEADLQTVLERCGKQVEKETQKLKPYQFIVWNDGNRTWRKETEPGKWFVSLKERKVA